MPPLAFNADAKLPSVTNMDKIRGSGFGFSLDSAVPSASMRIGTIVMGDLAHRFELWTRPKISANLRNALRSASRTKGRSICFTITNAANQMQNVSRVVECSSPPVSFEPNPHIIMILQCHYSSKDA
ncbi:hypothetical protein E4U54_007598 [Claviceps lovelessii]|nr:hypothetical protein E4U54_007598 [Claviceps lovelessii]